MVCSPYRYPSGFKEVIPSTPKYLNAILQFLHLLSVFLYFFVKRLILLSAVQEKPVTRHYSREA